jgi:C4-dicarboxylate-specific signal transduction histidine kinase
MDNQTIVLLTLMIRNIEDVIRARQRARQISTLLKFDLQNQTKIATAVSEIARNTYGYAKKSKMEFFLSNSTDHDTSLGIRISDEIPDISQFQQFNEKNPSINEGARRLADRLDIISQPGKGTVIWMEMDIPKNALPINQQMLAVITLELAKYQTGNISEEVQQQNYELLHALDLLSKAREELEIKVQNRTQQLTAAYQALQQETLERKQAEERLQKQQLELAKSARLSSMGEIGSALAHELNQPLAAITMFTQGCIRRLEDNTYPIAEIISSMKTVAQQAERAGDIIHRMKNFVGQGKLSHEAIFINQLVEGVIELMNYETRETEVTFKLNLSPNVLPVVADKIQLEQVLVNLIRNAIEAIRIADINKPLLIINTVLADDHHIAVDVIDNGPGFASEISQKILDPYFTTKAEGMGMGLSISRTIIEAYGGRLIARPHAEGGAWFQFTLPIAREINDE